MVLVKCYDRDGYPLPLFEWDGYYMPAGWSGHVPEEDGLVTYINDGEYTPDDILIVGFPRSGNHWLYENINMIVNKTTSPTNKTFANFNLEFRKLYQNPKESGPHIHQTHLPPELVPRRLKDAKTIYIYRNPKDQAWSYYNFCKSVLKYEGSFEGFIGLFIDGKVMYGSWFEHILKWEKMAKEKNICVLSYEEMSEKPHQTLKRLRDYLGLDADDDFLLSVQKACHISQMKDKEERFLAFGNTENLVSKGGVGGWKDHFTVSLNEQFDNVFKERMGDCRLPFKFNSN